jgi:hypothetical protein
VSRLTAAALSVTALAALSTLAGCGTLHPGVAIEAGDEQVSLRHVDEVSRDVCTVIQSDQRSKGTYPMESIRRGVVQSLALRSAASQLAEQYDVTPGHDYTQSVKLYESNLGAVGERERENAVEVLTAATYVKGVVDAVGALELHNAGIVGPSSTDIAAKGEAVFKAWTVELGIEIDPRFDLALSDNGIDPVRTDTSYALSDFAKDATADTPSDAFVQSLPPNQRCG